MDHKYQCIFDAFASLRWDTNESEISYGSRLHGKPGSLVVCVFVCVDLAVTRFRWPCPGISPHSMLSSILLLFSSLLFSPFFLSYQTPNPKTLKTTDTVDEAIVALLAAGINGAPVIDPITNNLVGCVTAFDFIQKEETGAILPFDMEDPETQKEMAVNARKIVATTVGELTTDKPLTVDMDTSMKDAAEMLTREKKHRLCVVDENNNLVGILSTSDVMRNIVDVLQALPETSSAATDDFYGNVSP